MKTSEVVRGMQNLRLATGRGAMQHTANGQIWATDEIANVIARLEEVAEAAQEFEDEIEEAFKDAGVDAYNRFADALLALKLEKERYE